MFCEVGQGEGLEPLTGLCGEVAGESRLSSLSPPSESFIQSAAPRCVSPSSCGLVVWMRKRRRGFR